MVHNNNSPPPSLLKKMAAQMQPSTALPPDFASTQQQPCTASSVVRALENFLASVDNMRETIMVPSRLKDTDVTALPVIASLNTATPAASAGPSPATQQSDLFTLYRILHAIHQELTFGDSESAVAADGDGSALNEEDSETLKLKKSFRFHLHGIFTTLRKLTDAANQMSKHYQQQIGLAEPCLD